MCVTALSLRKGLEQLSSMLGSLSMEHCRFDPLQSNPVEEIFFQFYLRYGLTPLQVTLLDESIN